MTGLPIRDDLVGAAPYGAPTDEVPVRLNVNENPHPPPADAVAAISARIAQALSTANRYPDREASQLRAALADHVGDGVGADQVWPANGSNEVMHQILMAFGGPGRTMLSFSPTYSMYPVYARDTFTQYVTRPREVDHSIGSSAEAAIGVLRPTLVVIASPNNPTGTVLAPDQLRRLHDLTAAADGILVIDEAYQEFSAAPSAVSALPDCPRLVVTRTLSKAFGLAGLRLGYAVSSAEIVDALRVVRLPYHLSLLTQAAGVAALEHAGALLRPIAEVVSERRIQSDWLRERGIGVADSHANFLLVGPLADSGRVFRDLLDSGVLVRETAVAGCLRVSVGMPAENAGFREAFAAVYPPDRRGSVMT